MQAEFLHSFSKDIDKIKDKNVKNALFNVVNEVKSADQIVGIKNIKKLKGFKNYYRIRIGDYRVGIQNKGTTIIFIRFLLRKDVYKYFP